MRFQHRDSQCSIPTNHEQYCRDECPNCADMVEEDRDVPCTMYYCQKKGSQEGVWVTAGDLNFLGEEGFIPKYQSIPITKLFQGRLLSFQPLQSWEG